MDASDSNETKSGSAADQREKLPDALPVIGSGNAGPGAGTGAGTMRSDQILFLLVIALFAISGFSSLVYQVLWTRMLVFVFGSTTFASSTVLAVFMGGLALGAFLAGRVCDRLKRPFLWYGILEGVIGIWALLAPFMFDAAVPLYKTVWQTFHVSVLPFSLFRFGVAACILLVPTTCMGATLPLLSRFVTVSLSKVGDRVGTLYAVNTLGAVGGALTAGFMLLPALGLNATTYVAVGLNILLLAIVLLASRKYESGELMELFPVPATTASESGSAAPTRTALPLHVVAAMIAFGCSGGVAMIYEVAWTRTLLMVIGSSTYAFTVMLSTFLVGIFVGSLVCARFVDRLKNPLAWFALAQVLLCVGGLISVYLFNYVPYWNMTINAGFSSNPNAALAVRFLLAAAVLMPITLCLGAIFPLVVKVCTGALESVGRSVGTLYSANTLGAIIGAFLAGFVIIPIIGVEHSLIWASMTNLLIGFGLIMLLGVPDRLKVLSGIGVVLCLILAAKQGTIWDQNMLMSAQTERRWFVYNGSGIKLPGIDQWRKELHESRKVAFWEDGACATVGVLQFPESRSLLTNGHVDASDSNDMRNQILIGAYPMLFNPKAKEVAVVGWGSGVSLGMSSVFPSANRLIGIEIEPAVLKAAKLFDHVNFQPDQNKKVETEINDGRNYLLATNDKFDAIISEPSNPWQAGVCNLFTSEFFHICKERLTDDGVLGIWIQYEEISTQDILRIFSAIRTQFKYTVPLASDGCMVVMASNQPIKLNLDSADSLIKTVPRIKGHMQKCDITNGADVLARIVCSSDVVGKLTQGIAPNTDDRNYLEFDVGKTYDTKLFQDENEKFLAQNYGTPWELVDWGKRDAKQIAAEMNVVSAEALRLNCAERAIAWAKESYKRFPNAAALTAEAKANMSLGNEEAATKLFAEAIKMEPKNADTFLQRGNQYLVRGNISKARADFETALAINPGDAKTKYYLAKTYTRAGRAFVLGPSSSDENDENPAQVLANLGGLLNDHAFVDKHPDVLLMAGIANLRTHNYQAAKPQLAAYIRHNPRTVLALRGLGTIFFDEGNQFMAANCWQRSLVNGGKQALGETRHARKLIAQGKYDDAARVVEHALEFAPGYPDGLILLSQLTPHSARAQEVSKKLGIRPEPLLPAEAR